MQPFGKTKQCRLTAPQQPFIYVIRNGSFGRRRVVGLTCLSNLIAGKLIDVTGERPVSRIPKSHNGRRQNPTGEQASTCQHASDISHVSRHCLTCGAERNLSKQRLVAGKRLPRACGWNRLLGNQSLIPFTTQPNCGRLRGRGKRGQA
jgi:hypothetical protein